MKRVAVLINVKKMVFIDFDSKNLQENIVIHKLVETIKESSIILITN